MHKRHIHPTHGHEATVEVEWLGGVVRDVWCGGGGCESYRAEAKMSGKNFKGPIKSSSSTTHILILGSEVTL